LLSSHIEALLNGQQKETCVLQDAFHTEQVSLKTVINKNSESKCTKISQKCLFYL
jgi:hypothetical protein